jgi:hypothetical protein
LAPCQKAVRRVIRQFAKERIGCSDIALDLGRTEKLSKLLSPPFVSKRDIVGDTPRWVISGCSFLQSDGSLIVCDTAFVGRKRLPY